MKVKNWVILLLVGAAMSVTRCGCSDKKEEPTPTVKPAAPKPAPPMEVAEPEPPKDTIVPEIPKKKKPEPIKKVEEAAQTDTVIAPASVVDAPPAWGPPPEAMLTLSSHLLEPEQILKAQLKVDKGDAPLRIELDWTGDGVFDWNGSQVADQELPIKNSGKYVAILKVTDVHNRIAESRVNWICNALPKVNASVVVPKSNLVTPTKFIVQAKDKDDSLTMLRYKFKEGDKWDTIFSPPSAPNGGNSLTKNLEKVYGVAGQYQAQVCITSSDKREVCTSIKSEVFDALPVCMPGPKIDVKPGVAIEVEGNGEDPDGKIVKWEWDLNGDGKYEIASSKNGKFRYTFTKEGKFEIGLKVTSSDGRSSVGKKSVEVDD